MLVLSRKLNETIVIGEGDCKIHVSVVEIDRGRVRLAIIAPRDILILRGELAKKENQHAKQQSD